MGDEQVMQPPGPESPESSAASSTLAESRNKPWQ